MHISKKYCTFAPENLRRRDVSLHKGVDYNILKASYALCFGLQESGKFIVPKHCDTKMFMVCILLYAHSARIVHTAWATVLLFGTKGNTRASVSGTARLQSRFFVFMREQNKSNTENAENP